MADYTDQEIQCRDCSDKFVFTSGEQSFFAEKEFSAPVRCKPCRDKRKANRDSGGQSGGQRRDNNPSRQAQSSYRTLEPIGEMPPVENRRRSKGRRRGREEESW